MEAIVIKDTSYFKEGEIVTVENKEIRCNGAFICDLYSPYFIRHFKLVGQPDDFATMVYNLRQKTGHGMLDCKKALQFTYGDIDKAEELLNKRRNNLSFTLDNNRPPFN